MYLQKAKNKYKWREVKTKSKPLQRFKVIDVDISKGESKKEGEHRESIEKKGRKKNLQKKENIDNKVKKDSIK